MVVAGLLWGPGLQWSLLQRGRPLTHLMFGDFFIFPSLITIYCSHMH